MTSTCKAPRTSCGTPSGWRAGGRCVRCRLAHNADINRYRSLNPEQRARFLDLLNAGLSVDDAAAHAGVTVPSLTATAAHDGELRAALNGQPVGVQRAARKGDLLSALTRTGGVMRDALLLVGIDADTAKAWRDEDPDYASAEDAVVRWLASARAPKRKRRPPLTNEELDKAADLLEQGESVEASGRAVGVSGTGLRKAAARHPRLAAAMPPPNTGQRRGGVSGLTPKVEAEIRQMWADPGMSTSGMARRIGTTRPTLRKWAESLGLPDRQKDAK